MYNKFNTISVGFADPDFLSDTNSLAICGHLPVFWP